MAEIEVADRAREDLREIRRFSKARFGAAVAVSYLDGLRQAIKGLGSRPMAGSAQEQFGPGIRKLNHRSHTIYYRYGDDRALVIRILHQAQDARGNLIVQ